MVYYLWEAGEFFFSSGAYVSLLQPISSQSQSVHKRHE